MVIHGLTEVHPCRASLFFDVQGAGVATGLHARAAVTHHAHHGVTATMGHVAASTTERYRFTTAARAQVAVDLLFERPAVHAALRALVGHDRLHIPPTNPGVSAG